MIIAVMAGGESKRMGTDKSFVKYRGLHMVERVLSVVVPISERTVIVANHPDRYKSLGVEVYPDLIQGMGPLSGLYTAFMKTGADQLMLAACDMPLINEEVVAFIISKAHLPGDAIVPICNGLEQGMLAIYRRSAINRFKDRIGRVDIQFNEFREKLDKSHISEVELRNVDPSLDSFKNVNVREDVD